MAVSPYTDPDSWRIALDATEATLSVHTRKGPRTLYVVPRIDGAFYLRPDGPLAGFSLQLPLPSSRGGDAPVLWWESADLDLDGAAWLRLGRQEARSQVSVLRAEIPGERPYLKIVMETVFPSWSLRLPALAWHPPRAVTLRLFSEIRSAEG
ncbi:hypothetical protein [Nonomuraea zeae]|uniref:Uncharacterized protein n=1 Tax=Nonomuraea zeae TaxID=1642303 RepID=A0A5S4HJP9_9ACTN|nr:hypothetical protein [Nonomuraea zeae]TMR39650.1 hypothetical protein ETD85_01165 [Nonomuraea zeae]